MNNQRRALALKHPGFHLPDLVEIGWFCPHHQGSAMGVVRVSTAVKLFHYSKLSIMVLLQMVHRLIQMGALVALQKSRLAACVVVGERFSQVCFHSSMFSFPFVGDPIISFRMIRAVAPSQICFMQQTILPPSSCVAGSRQQCAAVNLTVFDANRRLASRNSVDRRRVGVDVHVGVAEVRLDLLQDVGDAGGRFGVDRRTVGQKDLNIAVRRKFAPWLDYHRICTGLQIRSSVEKTKIAFMAEVPVRVALSISTAIGNGRHAEIKNDVG